MVKLEETKRSTNNKGNIPNLDICLILLFLMFNFHVHVLGFCIVLNTCIARPSTATIWLNPPWTPQNRSFGRDIVYFFRPSKIGKRQSIPHGQLTWTWNKENWRYNYLPLKMVMFHCHVSFRGGISYCCPQKKQTHPTLNPLFLPGCLDENYERWTFLFCAALIFPSCAWYLFYWNGSMAFSSQVIKNIEVVHPQKDNAHFWAKENYEDGAYNA